MLAPEAVWNLFLSEILTMGTLLYLLGTVAFFVVIVLILEFLDSTRVHRK